MMHACYGLFSGFGGGFMMGGWLLWLAIIAIIAVVIILAFERRPKVSPALITLDQEYAEGKISKEAYLERKNLIK